MGKFIVPTLKNVRLEVTPIHADVKFNTFSNLTFSARLPAVSGRGSDVDANLSNMTNQLLEILGETVPLIAQDRPDVAVPKVVAYLREKKPLIHQKLREIEQAIASPDISWVNVFNVVLTLRKTFQNLDAGLGLVSNNQVKLASVLDIGNLKFIDMPVIEGESEDGGSSCGFLNIKKAFGGCNQINFCERKWKFLSFYFLFFIFYFLFFIFYFLFFIFY